MREIWLLLDSRAAGGIESHVGELAAGLREAGAAPRVVFAAEYGEHPLRARLDRDGVPWEILHGGLPALVRRLRAVRPRVLHTHGYKANILGRLATRLTGTAQVATYHAGERSYGRLAVYDLIDRYSSFLSRRVAVSPPIRQRIPFGAVLIPNFVAVQPTPLTTGSETLAFVGRMSVEKGPDRFCDIANRLAAADCVAFGDGPMRAQLEATFGHRVRFMGAVAGMETHWAGIGLLVITSRGEGLPLAALEAMAHGVAVASFALGGLPDLIDDGRNGFLAAADDVDGLAARVAQWRSLKPAEKRAMSGAAWQTVTERFSRAAGVSAIMETYPAR